MSSSRSLHLFPLPFHKDIFLRLPLPTTYLPALVILSVLLAYIASYTALVLARRLTTLHGWAWAAWWLLGALILGLGIWSMHFIGMLALQLPVPVSYRLWPTLLSILPAVLASALVLALASRPQMTRPTLLLGSVLMGLGIVSMHYTGMQAVMTDAPMRYDPATVALSVLIAVVASGAALFVAFSLSRAELPAALQFRQLSAAALLAAGISGMHYTGMAAMTFGEAPELPMTTSVLMGGGVAGTAAARVFPQQTTLAVLVGGAVLLLFVLLAISLLLERLFARQHQRGEQLEGLVSERTAALQQALDENTRMYERTSTVLDTLEEGVMLTDPQGCVLTANRSASSLLGLSQAALVTQPLTTLPLTFETDRGQPLTAEQVWGGGGLLCRRVPDGTVQWLFLTRRRLPDSGETVYSFSDVTRQQVDARELKHQASTDALTGLWNRRALNERLPELLYDAWWLKTQIAVLVIDLDQFKQVNDAFGHAVGDEVLRMVGRRLKEALHQDDLLARLGGDEFSVVLHSVPSPEAALEVARRLLAVLRPAFYHGGAAFRLGASIGVSVTSDRGESGIELLRQADLAMYHVKRAGRNGAGLFKAEYEQAVQRQGFLERLLREAVSRNELHLAYQPLVRLDVSPGERRVAAFEALLRWNSGELGPVNPAEFIPTAEQAGFVHELDEWVLRRACHQAAAWRAQGHEVEVAVNVSALHVQRGTLLATVRAALSESLLPARLLRLELTESALIRDMEDTVRQMHVLREMGVQLALDDFGTGYSSLSWLQSLPIGQLKLDRSLLVGSDLEPRRRLVLESFVALARSLNMEVVVEGIETPAQLQVLGRRSGLLGQGYLFSRPVPPDEALRLLQTPGAGRALTPHLQEEPDGPAVPRHDLLN